MSREQSWTEMRLNYIVSEKKGREIRGSRGERGENKKWKVQRQSNYREENTMN